jgi:hypothetical protein
VANLESDQLNPAEVSPALAGDLATVARVRQGLWDRGYRPIEIASIDCPVASPGKQPAFNGWPEGARRDVPEAVERPPTMTALNTGILADGLRAIDIDVFDLERVMKIVRLAVDTFGAAPVRYREDSNRCLILYRAAEGAPPKIILTGRTGYTDGKGKVKADKIEVIGKNFQFVAHGLHPDTGAALEWTYPPPRRDELTPVTEAQIEAFLAAAAPIIDADPSATQVAGNGYADGPQPAPIELAPPSLEALLSLIAGMPNPASVDRGLYLRILFAIAGCRAGLAAVRGEPLSLGEDQQIGNAAAVWAASWAGGGMGWKAEYDKWNDDIARPRPLYTGWRQLAGYAQAVGAPQEALREIAMRAAQDAFSGEPAPRERARAVAALCRPPGPEVRMNGADRGVIAKNIGEVLGGSSPDLFFSNGPVRLNFGGYSLPVIEPLLPYAAAAEAYRICRPVTIEKDKAGAYVITPTPIPEDVMKLAMAEPDRWGLRPLSGITSAPVLREGGEILAIDGYDPMTKLWCHDVPALQVPEKPTLTEARLALQILRHQFRTFPFADAETEFSEDLGVRVVDLTKAPGTDETSFLNALLTAICRASLRLAPGYAVGAPGNGAGSGKGLLVSSISQIAFGRAPSAQTHSGDAAEFEKRLVSAFLECGPVIYIDNVNAQGLKCDALASGMTERPIALRPLGGSKNVVVDSSAWIVVTGNGFSVSEDLVRRFVTSMLDAKMEDPGSRPFEGGVDGFLAAIRGRRAELLEASLTIWRWGQLGCQGAADKAKEGKALGSFETWCTWVRDPLLALGCKDPVVRVTEAKSENLDNLRTIELFEMWHRKHGGNPVSLKALDSEAQQLILPANRVWTGTVSWQALTPHLNAKNGTRVAGAVFERFSDVKRGGGAAAYRLRIEDREKWEAVTGVAAETSKAPAGGNVFPFIGAKVDARDVFKADDAPKKKGAFED